MTDPEKLRDYDELKKAYATILNLYTRLSHLLLQTDIENKRLRDRIYELEDKCKTLSYYPPSEIQRTKP